MPITKTKTTKTRTARTKTKPTKTKTSRKSAAAKKVDQKSEVKLKIPKISGKKKKIDVELTREEIGLAVACIEAAAKVETKEKAKLLKLSKDLSGILADD